MFMLIDLLGMLDGGVSNSPLGGILNSILGSVVFLNVITVIMVIVMLAALYVITSFKWQFIGRKAGLQKDWMPFVPFARTVYKLSIIDEPWWRMFFKDGFALYASLLILIINAISNYRWLTFSIVLATLYGLCYVVYNVYFRYKFYTAHNIKPHFCMSLLVPLAWPILSAWDYMIAFGRNYPFTGEGTTRALMDVVEIPQMKDSRGNPVAVTQAAVASNRGAPWEGDRGASPAAGGGSASITGMSGMYAGQTLPLASNDEMIIGRDNSMCNLIVDQNAEKVSRKHCGITFDPGRGIYMVTDYSSNGTFIDGGNRLVANMPTSLQRGSVIALGSRENRFKLN